MLRIDGRRTAAVLIAGALTASCVWAQTVVPEPEVAGVEPRVREKVETHYARVLARPDDADAWGRYGVVLDAHRMTKAAVEVYAQAWRLDPADFRWPYHLGSILLFEDPERALIWLERALEIDSSYAPGQIRMGEMLENLGRDEDARRHFSRAFELNPDDPLASFGLGRLALAWDDVATAIRPLERAYELGPEIQAIAATLARAYNREGRRELAQRLAQEARSLPRMTHHQDRLRGGVREQAVDTESYLRRARTYADVGQLERARAELETLMEIEPDLAMAHFAAAGVYDRLGLADRALSSAQQAHELEPALAGSRAVVAGALFKLGRTDEARNQANRVLEEEPDNVHMLMIVSLAVAETGNFEELLGTLDRAYEARTNQSPMRHIMMQMLADVGESFAAVDQRAVAREWMGKAVVVAEESGEKRAAEEFRSRLRSFD